MTKTVIIFKSAENSSNTIIQTKIDKLCKFLELEPKIRTLPIEDSPENIADSTPISAFETVFVCSLCPDLKLLLRGISHLIKSTTVPAIVLLEDLIVTERPYVYSSRERQFFREYSRLISIRPIDLTITSSNAIRNSYGEDDTFICSLPEIAESNYYWDKVKECVQFHEMMNQGNAVPRLVSIQSIANAELGRPLYRHPNDEEPPNVEMIPIVREIMQLVERHTGITGINHVLIQWYRNGRDNIAAHSDKTLDIDLHTPIINVSLGVERVMTIQHKRERINFVEKIALTNGECVVFGLKTNQYWHHEVAKDMVIKPHPEFNQERISFTFRKIATFINDDGIIVGQGSPYKTGADIVLKSDDVEVQEMKANQTRVDLIHAFSSENRQAEEFNWNEVYGKGFLVR